VSAAYRTLKSDNRPLYDQAVEALNRFIDEGSYKPGDRLPAEGELARQLGISRPTLREAFGTLENNGVIERRHGVGTFVTSPPQGVIRGGLEQLVSLRALVDNAGFRSSCADWVVGPVPAPLPVAEKLLLEPDSPVLRVQMTSRTEDDTYIAYMESYIPQGLLDEGELRTYNRGSMLNFLLERGEPRLSYTHTFLHSVAATADLAGWLHIPEGSPLQLLEETYHTDEGSPVMHEYNYFNGGRLNFHIIRRIVTNA